MLTRTILALATLVGGAVAGCATGPVEPGEPVIVMEQLSCVEAASLLGIDLGNREVRIVNPAPGHYDLDDVGFLSLTLRPTADGGHLEWSASLGVYGVIVERAVGRAAEVDQLEPHDFAERPSSVGVHLEWAEELGIYDAALYREAELYLRDPSIAGPSMLPASLHPRTKAPLDILAVRVCLER